jgi:hypothetical protein
VPLPERARQTSEAAEGLDQRVAEQLQQQLPELKTSIDVGVERSIVVGADALHFVVRLEGGLQANLRRSASVGMLSTPRHQERR